jgi:hypothetical protein
MDPVIRVFILGVITAFGAALIGALVGGWVTHRLTIAREERKEKYIEKERFLRAFKILKRRAYNLTEDINTYKKKPDELTTIYISFERFRDYFILFTEAIESDYLEKTLSEDDYVAFNHYVAKLGGMLDIIARAIEIKRIDFATVQILKLPLSVLKDFTDKTDKVVGKWTNESDMKLNLKKGFFRLTIVLSVLVGFASLLVGKWVEWVRFDLPDYLYSRDYEMFPAVSYPLAFMLGVALTWIVYLLSRYVILNLVTSIVDFIKEGFRDDGKNK